MSPSESTVPKADVLEVDGFRLRFWEQGTGDPIVAIHGGDGPDPGDEATALLARRRRVLMLEMPGWGEESNERTQSLQEMASVVSEAARALDLGPFALLGTSIGGAVAAWVALTSGLPITHLVLEAPAAFRAGGSEWDGRPPQPSDFNVRPEKQRERSIPPRIMQFMMKMAPPGVNDEDLANRLRDLSVPLLALWGDQDRLVPPDRFQDYYLVAPLSKVVRFAEAGHDLKGDRPEEFANLVEGFLAHGLDSVAGEVP